MKKKIIILIVLLSAIFLTGCGDTKESLNSETFTTQLEEKNFTIVEQTDNLLYDTSSIESYMVATSPDGTYQLEFFIYTNESSAQAFYAKQKEHLGNLGANSELNVGNFSKYTQTSNGKFSVVSRVGSTLLYTTVDEMYRTEVNDLIKEIGY